uniref:Uncharacterized protein n=1 Tax=Chenopodium quinoa TaxID=63459 RepID=A0A803LH32_CHEQI
KKKKWVLFFFQISEQRF